MIFEQNINNEELFCDILELVEKRIQPVLYWEVEDLKNYYDKEYKNVL